MTARSEGTANEDTANEGTAAGDAVAAPGRPREGALEGVITERARCVLAPNPSVLTLDGTNTWILAEPGSDQAVVVDPGPLDEGHLRQVAQLAEAGGRRVALTLLTHGHWDHAEGAARFAELTGSPVRARDPKLRAAGPDGVDGRAGAGGHARAGAGMRAGAGAGGLETGDVIRVDGLELVVVPTPGHTADSVSFHLPADRAVLTGDTVLGRGTTFVAHPDGRLGDYLDSLRLLRSLTVDEGVTTILPGHGPVLTDARGAVEYYLAHRANRLAQIETAVEQGYRTAEEVVAHVYAGVDRSLWPAAELSVRAQLDYLREHGLI